MNLPFKHTEADQELQNVYAISAMKKFSVTETFPDIAELQLQFGNDDFIQDGEKKQTSLDAAN